MALEPFNDQCFERHISIIFCGKAPGTELKRPFPDPTPQIPTINSLVSTLGMLATAVVRSS